MIFSLLSGSQPYCYVTVRAISSSSGVGTLSAPRCPSPWRGWASWRTSCRGRASGPSSVQYSTPSTPPRHTCRWAPRTIYLKMCRGVWHKIFFCLLLASNIFFQKTLGGEFTSFRSVFKSLLRERGVRGMFRGVHVNYTRSFMSWGIINMTYGYLLRLLRTEARP